ncbi:hypothetical protein Tco_0913088 [Tanacetum coccineum]
MVSNITSLLLVVVVPEYAANGSRLCHRHGWGVCISRLSIFGGVAEAADANVARESLGYCGLHQGKQHAWLCVADSRQLEQMLLLNVYLGRSEHRHQDVYLCRQKEDE